MTLNLFWQDDSVLALGSSSYNWEEFTCWSYWSGILHLILLAYSICTLIWHCLQLTSVYLIHSWCNVAYLNHLKISALAENTQSSIVFSEVLATAGKDIVTKDITRMRGGWPMQDAFYVSSILSELWYSMRRFSYMTLFYLIFFHGYVIFFGSLKKIWA